MSTLVIARHILHRSSVVRSAVSGNSDVSVLLSQSKYNLRKPEPVCSSVQNYQLQIFRNKGHSHWQNIRHIKGAKDAERQRHTSFLIGKLRVAVKMGGGSIDPKVNTQVASVLDEAKAKGIPKTSMTDYLKKLDDKSNYKVHTVEAKGPGQSLFIIEALTDKPVAVSGNIQAIMKKNQGRVGNKVGFASFGFDHRGQVTVAAEGRSLDEMTDVAIECEAEDVEETEDEDGDTCYLLSCPAEDLYKVKGNLEKANITVKKATATWEPKNLVSLTDQEQELVDKIFTKLQNIEEIEEIYDNLEHS